MSAQQIEGDYIDKEGAVKLLAYILGKIKSQQNPRIVSTMSVAQTTESLLPTGEDGNWTAAGTLLQVTELTALTSNMKFRVAVTIVPPNPGYDLYLIPAVYRYNPENPAQCSLIAAGETKHITDAGWYDSEVTQVLTQYLDPNESYFLVYLHNIVSCRLLGFQSAAIDSNPYIAWTTLNLGNISEVPATLDIQATSPTKFFGTLYVNRSAE